MYRFCVHHTRDMFRKIVKRFTSIVLVAAILFAMGLGSATSAYATSISAPSWVKADEDIYYTYWDKHYSELTKEGYAQGDIGSVEVKWDKVSGADGYKVKVVWYNEEEGSHSNVVNVVKKGNKYIMTSKSSLYKNARALAVGNSKNKLTTKKLKVDLVSDGSIYTLKKVSVKSYKIVNGKKVWSKAKVFKY